ncbi:MAG TPA: cobyrinate a,c-diamide synthase [Nitrospirales bacterium]|nr:cobyrinate a,c-diamide synthase [Nitrospirales bacterium]
MEAPRLLIAGTHSGVGKTTVTLGLLAALSARGRRVQAFKIGPDFIDPTHHTAATGRPSRNLDGWMLGRDTSLTLFAGAARDADVSIIEGMMGLFDGAGPTDERGSAAEMAKALGVPVILVVDGQAMARSAAAMVAGYAAFDPGVSVRGVIFNRVRHPGHYQLLKAAVEAYTPVRALGYLRPDAAFDIPERHLGVRTAVESEDRILYERIGQAMAETVDLEAVEALARDAPFFALPSDTAPSAVRHASRPVRIAVARDAAFCFYYQDNLDLLTRHGAELVAFSPLRDAVLPSVDLLYLGGGYPELHAAELERNVTMRASIRAFAERDGAIYAECGGLMYLTRAIVGFDGHRHEMVGIFPAETEMERGAATLGYRDVETTAVSLLGEPGTRCRGHEFHHSRLRPDRVVPSACRVMDVRGTVNGQDGLMYRRVLALYTHLHFLSQPTIAASLIDAAAATAAAARV